VWLQEEVMPVLASIDDKQKTQFSLCGSIDKFSAVEL
jgi:hypothetical protein